MSKIAPCPFCGGTNLDVSDESEHNHLQRLGGGKCCIAIRCWNCDVIMFDHTYSVKNYPERREMLLTKWNRRIAND